VRRTSCCASALMASARSACAGNAPRSSDPSLSM
jgi:hypothetical protein